LARKPFHQIDVYAQMLESLNQARAHVLSVCLSEQGWLNIFPMATLVQAFAGVHWLWICKWSAVLSCLFLFVPRWPWIKQPSLLADLGSSVLLGAFWIVSLIVTHASPAAIEVVLTLFSAYVIEALVRPFWTGRGAKKTEKDVAMLRP
jgi:hypothetical protein